MEQFKTGTIKDFMKSMALLISFFYVFNAEYSSKIENTLTLTLITSLKQATKCLNLFQSSKKN